VEGGWLPLPTRPQRYCDPASLVYASAIQIALSATFVIAYKFVDDLLTTCQRTCQRFVKNVTILKKTCQNLTERLKLDLKT